MPFTVEMKRKVVKFNKKTRLVIQAFNAALRQNKIEKSTLLPTIPQTRKGLWSLIAQFEDFTNVSINTNTCELERIEVELDPPAKILRDEYINFLNQLGKDNGIKSPELVAEKIKNYYVLIRKF